jgi:hypothetical protein
VNDNLRDKIPAYKATETSGSRRLIRDFAVIQARRMRRILRVVRPPDIWTPIREALISRKPHWHIIGDSHVGSFQLAARRGLLTRPAIFTRVAGATAVGLRNPNSKTDALGVFRRALTPYNKNKIPVIHLGEVDCGFVIWYRAQKYGESIDTQFAQSVDALLAFVDDLRGMGYDRIVLTGATLPTILDGQDWGDVANARREVTSTLTERTDLTLRYNARLREGTIARGLPFLDLTDDVLDPRTGLVSEAFRHPDPTDHHLNPEKVGPLWANALNALRI